MSTLSTGYIVAITALGTGCALGAGGAVAVDQLGYTTQSPKYAFVTNAADSFFVRDAATGTIQFRGPLALRQNADPATGKAVYLGDFTPLQTAGEWIVVTSQNDSSFRFVIVDSVFNRAWHSALKGFYFQRCGTGLLPGFAGPWQHAACHLSDGVFHSTAESTGVAQMTGGWHDAGDYNKYVVNAGISVGTLLMAYELFPLKFANDHLGIPESGNGVPDILDEVRFELAWLLKMQKSGGGGVFFKLTKEQFEGFIMPQNDLSPPPRYIYRLSTCATGDFAAVMARASRVYRPIDSTFANTCLSAARRGWAYLQSKPTIVPSGGFTNPPGTVTGVYGDGNDSDERLWAAAELFETTGEQEFLAYYNLLGPSSGYISGPMWWGGVGPLAHLTYMLSSQPTADVNIRAEARQSLVNQCQVLVNKRNASGFQVALQPSEYFWGSNSGALNSAILLILGYRESGESAYKDAAEDQLHYVLGANALGRSFVTGLGTKPPMHIHHRPSESDGVVNPVPGLIAGGPNKNLEDPVLAALFTPATPAALCYSDSMPSYASNEIAINWNAPLVFVAGYFSEESGTNSVRDDGQPRGSSRDFRLEQNFPNPFNGETHIRFSMEERQDVALRVTDILGRVVFAENLGSLSPGLHEIVWVARDTQDAPLSSGTYFYYLAGKERSTVRRLLFVK